ncbi:DUF6230 family protein [Saccharothrix sp. HUAS TT1]|uniref:DUF6230 family protein n=1 Tax=unclassified Saccharothrix TaxID=2593673 RepID=UPI00345BEFB7
MDHRDRPPGRTSRRRLVAVLAPTAVASAVVLGGIAEGVIGVSFTSGSPITIAVDRVESDGLALGIGPTSADAGLPTLLARLPAAELSGLCQSAAVDLPVVGRVTTVLRAEHVRTSDLALEVDAITGGLDLAGLVVGPLTEGGPTGYRAGRTTLEDVRISAGSVTAGTFTITGLDLSHHRGDGGCSSAVDGPGR